jgi:hypothetical protein
MVMKAPYDCQQLAVFWHGKQVLKVGDVEGTA